MKNIRPLFLWLFVSILLSSLVNAEPYKGGSFPSDEVIAKNIPALVNMFLKRSEGRTFDVKVQNIAGKIDKEDKSYRIFYCYMITPEVKRSNMYF